MQRRERWEPAWVPPVLVVSAWLFLLFFALLSPLLSLAAAAMLLRRGAGKAALALALSPLILLPVFWFCWGIGSYCRGDAAIYTFGLRRGAHRDPDTGFPIVTSGCVVRGHEFLWQQPNNGGVMMMTWLCGRR